MTDRPPKTERVVVQRLVGFEAELITDADGASWLTGTDGQPLPRLATGERIKVLTPVQGDATYATGGRVLTEDPDGQVGRVRVEVDGQRQREQQREHVRVPTPPIDVRLVEGEAGALAQGDLLNVSAGGIRTVTDLTDVEVGAELQCVFALPGGKRKGVEVNLPGEVMWVGKGPQGKTALGIRFTQVDQKLEAQLASWVIRQQAAGSV